LWGSAVALRLGRPWAPPRPPAGLQATLASLAQDFPGEAGIAVMDLDSGWIAGVRQDAVFPQQSVAKLWVAISVLDRIDHGQLAYDTPVAFLPQDLSVFSQPIAQIV